MRPFWSITLAATALTAPPTSAQTPWAASGGGDERYGASAAEGVSQPRPLASDFPSARVAANPSATNPSAPKPAPSGMSPVDREVATRATVTSGNGSLPSTHGQVWREYDIRPYTLRVANTTKPEQTIVDWVLRETGYEAWHSEPLGVLSATRETLRVYHTPQMQSIVADIVDRFVNSRAEPYGFSLRVASVRSPNWRAKAVGLMSPIPVQSPGVQGWVMAKENAALLLADLARRSDFREHNASSLMVLSGQQSVLSTMRPRSYVRGLTPSPASWPGFQPEVAQLEEGVTLEFSPLISHDLASADAVVKVRLLQIEKMTPVQIDIPTATGNQRMQIEVPQMTMATLHERFRWPTEQVLVLSMGVVASPAPDAGRPLLGMIPGVDSPPRADGLLFIEVRGTGLPAASPTAPATAARTDGTSLGRY